MVVNHVLNVAKDFGVAAVGFLRHAGYARRSRVEDAGGLRVEDEGDCQETFDPFWK